MKGKWFRRMLAGALSAVMCCGMLTGCGKGVEQTNEELNIYVSEEGSKHINYALQLFQSQHPEVALHLTIIEDAETEYAALSASLMTGKDIPDLLIIDPAFLQNCDIYKMQQSGAFFDLTPLLAEDSGYDAASYQTAVVDGMQYDGKQYVYPISFDMPYIVSTQENLRELGVTAEEFKAWNVLDFLKVIKEKSEEKQVPVNDIVSGRLYSERHNAANVCAAWYDTDLVDYVNRQTNIDANELQEYIETAKILSACGDEAANTQGLLYSAICLNELSLKTYADYATKEGETPVLTCLRNKNGEINASVWLAAAIPQLSANQNNAYQLLKLLISPEVQNYRFTENKAVGFAGVYTQVLTGASHIWAEVNTEEGKSIRAQDLEYQSMISGSFLYNEGAKLVMEQAEEYYNGNCTAEQAVESVEKKLKIYVSE